MIVRQKDIDVRQQRFQPRQIIARPGVTTSSTVLAPARRAVANTGGQRFRLQFVHQKIAAEVQHLAMLDAIERNVGRAKPALAPNV